MADTKDMLSEAGPASHAAERIPAAFPRAVKQNGPAGVLLPGPNGLHSHIVPSLLHLQCCHMFQSRSGQSGVTLTMLKQLFGCLEHVHAGHRC